VEVDEDEHEEACPGAAVRRLLRFGADEREGSVEFCGKRVNQSRRPYPKPCSLHVSCQGVLL